MSILTPKVVFFLSSRSMKNTDGLIFELARVQHGIITLRQALELGLTKNQVGYRTRTGTWLRVLPRTFLVAGAAWDFKAHLMATCLWSGGVASHRSAAILHDLLPFEKPIVEVTTIRNCKSYDGKAIIHRTSRLPIDFITSVEGIPCTDIERTLLDLPQIVYPKRVSMALDKARREGKVTLGSQSLRCEEEARSGRNGLNVVRNEIARRDPRASIAQSQLEDTVFQILTHPSIPSFTRHFRMDTGRGYEYEIDACWVDLNKGAEVNDHGTHSDLDPFNKDGDKMLFFAERGMQIIPITREMTKKPDDLRMRVLNFLRARPPQLRREGE